MDATGLVALESAIAQLSKNGCVAILAGLQAQPQAAAGEGADSRIGPGGS